MNPVELGGALLRQAQQADSVTVCRAAVSRGSSNSDTGITSCRWPRFECHQGDVGFSPLSPWHDYEQYTLRGSSAALEMSSRMY